MLSWHDTAGALIPPRGYLVFGDFFASLAGTDGRTQRLSGRVLFGGGSEEKEGAAKESVNTAPRDISLFFIRYPL
ncbi:hypothetical protein D7Y04_27960 [Corallococcus sp. AB038B]|nr:hypothetical protein D7Y04_27960 [Corallococcus sp. AB038B]